MKEVNRRFLTNRLTVLIGEETYHYHMPVITISEIYSATKTGMHPMRIKFVHYSIKEFIKEEQGVEYVDYPLIIKQIDYETYELSEDN